MLHKLRFCKAALAFLPHFTEAFPRGDRILVFIVKIRASPRTVSKGTLVAGRGRSLAAPAHSNGCDTEVFQCYLDHLAGDCPAHPGKRDILT